MEIQVDGHLPVETSRLTFGAVLFGEERNWRVLFAHTSLLSPDRNVARPAPITGEDLEPTKVIGEGAALDDVNLSMFEGGENPNCDAWFCANLEFEDPHAGPIHAIVWMAGVSQVDARVVGDTIQEVEANRGDAVAIGDAELPAGTANAQVQATACDSRTNKPGCPTSGFAASYDAKAGAKTIANVDVGSTIEQRLWGYWQVTDVKLVCQFTIGICLDNAVSKPAYDCDVNVHALAGQQCDRADLSYDGPGRIGADLPFGGYSLTGLPSGEYTFTVERMVDAWGPRVFDPLTFNFVFMGEYFTTLTYADVELPR